MSGNEPFVKIQRNAIRKNLLLSEVDREKVIARMVDAAKRGATRVVMLAIVKFEDDEVRIISDMVDFVRSFDHVRFVGDHQQISCDDFSIAMLGESGEDAYKQFMSIEDFLTRTHQGWFLTKRDAVATYKKPRNFWKQLANMFESYDKKFTEYRLIVDTRKTADIRQQPLIKHERSMLYGATKPLAREKSQASETAGSVSSGVFSRGSNSLLKRIEPKSTEWSKVEKPEEKQGTNANSGSENEGDDNDTLGTLSKEYHKELEKEAKLRRQLSSSSLSSSSKSITKKLKMKSRKH